MAKKKFKVQAEIITHAYVIVEADSKEEANAIADEMAQNDVPFITEENGGEFNILESMTEETNITIIVE